MMSQRALTPSLISLETVVHSNICRRYNKRKSTFQKLNVFLTTRRGKMPNEWSSNGVKPESSSAAPQLEITRVSSSSRLLAGEVRQRSTRAILETCRFESCPRCLALKTSRLMTRFETFFRVGCLEKRKEGKEEGGGGGRDLSNPLFKDFLLQTKKELTGQVLPCCLAACLPACRLTHTSCCCCLRGHSLVARAGWKQQCADVLTPGRFSASAN